MLRSTTILLDPEKLRRKFKIRGLIMSRVSLDLGYGPNYFSNCCRLMRISKAAALSLQSKYDILVEEYEATKEAPAAEPVVSPEIPPAPSFELDYERLYNLVYKAVYLAIKKAWAE